MVHHHKRSGSYSRNNLTEEQVEILNEFIQVLEEEGLTDRERQFCNEACLIRYLVARDWSLSKSHKMIRNTLKWREEYKPDQISFNEIKSVAETGKLYNHGCDKSGRPIVIMVPARENSKDYAQNLRYVVYTIERAVAAMPPGVEQMALLIDFKGYSRHNAPPLNVSLETLNILSNHYPERLGLALMVDSPWLFSLAWKAISPFINPRTHSKIHFLSGDEKKEKLLQYIESSDLEQRYGGQSAFLWNLESYFSNEIAVASGESLIISSTTICSTTRTTITVNDGAVNASYTHKRTHSGSVTHARSRSRGNTTHVATVE